MQVKINTVMSYSFDGELAVYSIRGFRGKTGDHADASCLMYKDNEAISTIYLSTF